MTEPATSSDAASGVDWNDSHWVDVCPLSALPREVGVPAMAGADAVAVFRLDDDTLYAVSHHDPVTGAPVIARGIVGSRGDVPTVASPVYKDVYDLRTGRCLDAPDGAEGKALRRYPVRVRRGVVQVCAPPLVTPCIQK